MIFDPFLGPTVGFALSAGKPAPSSQKAFHSLPMIFLGKVRKRGGAAYVTRTRDPIITNDVLYQLS